MTAIHAPYTFLISTMSNPREKMHLCRQDCPVAELDAQPRTASQVGVTDNAIYELSGESVVSTQSTQSSAGDIIYSTGDHNLPQANPWPFYLDEAEPSRSVNKGGCVSHTTTVLEPQPAHPWPYHGVDVELHERCNDLKWDKESHQCHNTMVSRPLGHQVPPKAASSDTPDTQSNMSDDAKMLNLSQTGNKVTGCLDNRFDPKSSLDTVTTLPLNGKACGNLTGEMVKEDFRKLPI